MSRYVRIALIALWLATLPLWSADVAPGANDKKQNSLIDPPEVAIRKFTVAPGLKVDLFAAEPDVRNPVALSIDEHGRVFVVESDRRRSSVFDIRGHKEWLESDFSFRTVSNRAAFLRAQVSPTNPAVIKRLAGGGNGSLADFNQDGVIDWRDLEVQSERIRLLEDTDGDGRADRMSVFADGFTNIVAGVAAGVLAQRGDVYFACIPDLWKFTNYELRLTNTTAPAEPRLVNRQSDLVNLQTGFGVHIAFGGHDMHGLIFGPDGKLYWSIADRGTDTNLFAKLKNPAPGLTPELLADSGCVFRANPDGGDFEVIAWGLRNPQELAFDDYGNLFTADNNGDGGDKARWHYVVEGADFGWRIGWQWLEARAYQPKMGPWNGERLWHLAASNTAAYLLPPLAHIGHGPAGLAYNPGTGLPAQFDRHFFLCDFPGAVLMWTNIPDGASFKVGPVKNLFGDLGPTDVAFHPDGGVLVSDWFKSFDKSDKGRIYRIHDPATDASAAVQETKCLLADGMATRSVKELAQLLGHRDMRVRLEAQWEITERAMMDGKASTELTRTINPTNANSMGRLHATRALGNFMAKSLAASNAGMHRVRAGSARYILQARFDDEDDQVRAAAVAALASNPRGVWFGGVLADESPRVRLAAVHAMGLAMADPRLSKEDKQRNIPPVLTNLFQVLVQDGADLYLRHAAVLALARIGDKPALIAAANDASRSVRLGVLLALRRLGSAEVARFLDDADPQLILEAARAINDVPIVAAYPQLAALLPGRQSEIGNLKSEITFFTLRRALNANFRVGHATNALALANFAARTDAPEALRIEALELLGDWPKPPARDHFMGLYRPLPAREGKPAADALRPILVSLLGSAPKDVKLQATKSAAALGVKEADLFALVADVNQAPEVRVEALKTLAAEKDARLPEALKLALADKNESLRIEAGRWQGGGGDALAQWTKTLTSGSIAEKQGVLASLAGAKGEAADDLLAKQLDALLVGTLPKELTLDVLDAAKKNSSDTIMSRVKKYEASLPKDDTLAPWRMALYGGNAAEGRKIFIENQNVACFRCHKINGEGGEVGSDLTGVGAKRGREYLLESIVFPNKEVAPGFEQALITLKSGTEYAGTVKGETDAEVSLLSAEDGLVKIPKADIKARLKGLSAMPEELGKVLTRRELRDVIEFLDAAR